MKTKILIRGTNWLGDAIMSLPAVKLIIKSFPDSDIDILTIKKLQELYEFVPGIKRVLTFEKFKGVKEISEKIRFGRALKKVDYSHCFIFPNSFDSALIPFIAGIKTRTGFNLNFRGGLLTSKILPPKDFFSEHHSNHYLRIVKESGYATSEAGNSDALLLKIPEELKKISLNELDSIIKGTDGYNLYAMSPGAEYGESKKWPVERYKEICSRLLQSKSKILIFGNKADARLGEILASCNGNVYNLAGKTNLRQFISYLSCCRLLITNDSGAMHVGGALGIPVVAVFGSTAPLATKALGKVEVCHYKIECSPCFRRKCIHGHYLCLLNISVHDVWAKVEKYI